MRLKLYRAPSMTQAMARVRAELGPDALILSTRRVADGVEVTAALEPEDELPIPPPPAAPALPERAKLLAWHGVPNGLAARLANGTVQAALAGALRFGSLPIEAAPLLFAGPPGAGKTLSVARLATRLVMAGQSPMIITTDGRRAGATEQLAAFTRLLGLTLIVASHPATLARALLRRTQGVPVLIDAPGTDPFDPASRDEITGLASTAGATTALVLPAGLDPAESAELAAGFAQSGASLLIATRLDIVRRLGSVLAAADGSSLTLVEAGIGPGAADGMTPLTPALLAERLVQAAPPHADASHAELPR